MVKENFSKLTIVFLLFLAIAGYFRIQYSFAEGVWVDETVFMWQGYRLLHSPGLLMTPDYYGNTPFPLMIIALFNIFSHDRFIAGRLTAYFFSMIGIIFVYLIGKELKNEYVGILAALLTTFNHLHWFLGSRMLMDLPETTMVSLSVYALLHFEKEKTTRHLFLLLFAVLATTLTKLPGILILPGIMVYYLLRLAASPSSVFAIIPEIRKKSVRFKIIGGILLVFFGFSVFNINRLLFFMRTLMSMTPRLVFIEHLPFMFTSTIVFFIVIGTLLTFFYRKWESIAIVCVFFSFLLAFSFLPAEPDPRHIVPIIPLGMILASFAFFELGSIVKYFFHVPFLEIALLVMGSFFVFPLYEEGVASNVNHSYSFTGYNEAGQWLTDNLPKNTLAYVSSQGPIRLFSGLGYADEGGPIRQIQTFGEGPVPNFSKGKVPIYLHIDLWERGPAWSYPLNDQKIQALQKQGFRVAKVVTRKAPTQQGLQDVPAHIFLIRD